MDKETSEEVSIVVKSPYQLFPDQTICCSTDWTVERLKEEISIACPSHPVVKEQKLIYWGKLLDDKATLRSTLKIYEEGQANHTVHLVMKSDHAQQSRDGLRQRHTNSSPSGQQTSSTHQVPSGNAFTPQHFPSYMYNQQFYGHQQQQPIFNPSQFFGQPLSNSQFFGQSFSSSSQVFGGGVVQGSPFSYQQQSTMIQNPSTQDAFHQQMAFMRHAYAQYVSQYMQMMQHGGGVGGSLPQTGGIPIHQHHQQQAPVVVPNNDPENPDGERPRDWLDWFYLSSRALIFLTIVCFYSSPFRFLLVLSIGFAIYLYQSGFFRYQGPALLIAGNQPPPPQIPVPVNPNNNNNNVRPENDSSNRLNTDSTNENPINRSDENQQSNSSPSVSSLGTNNDRSAVSSRTLPTGSDSTNSQPSSESTRSSSINTNVSSDNIPSDRPTVLHLTWSIVANFFASLLPEQANLV